MKRLVTSVICKPKPRPVVWPTMVGRTYRDVCLLQSALLRERAQQIADEAHESMPVNQLVDLLVELHDLHCQVDQLEDFLMMLDARLLTTGSAKIGLPS